MPDELTINCEPVRRAIVDFIAHFFAQAGFERAVMGLSGGLDSAVTALLTTQALGRGPVRAQHARPPQAGKPLRCLVMPCGEPAADTPAGGAPLADIEAILALTGAERMEINIGEQLDAYFRRFPDADRVRRGNKMARERMSILYDQSCALRALVVGTSNRTEWLLGYFTLWGDMAAALWPLASLYKTQVRQMARHLGVPERIIAKPPTADLWRGQTDEGELGVTYDDADRILYRLVDLELSVHQVVADGFAEATVNRVVELMRASAFKRHLPATPELTQAAPEDDFI